MEYFIERASSFAADIDLVILIVAVLGGFWFFVAQGVLFYFIFKYRRRPGQKAQYITGEKKEEMKWIHLPHNLILVCDVVIIIFAIKVWYQVKQDLPPAQETVRIIGQQWSWTFIHPGKDGLIDTDDDVAVVDELRLKHDTLYHYKLESKDVLHSFSVPVFRLKQDAVPGRIITGWFKPTKIGTYDIQCAEMCGIGHGIMGSRLYVESDEDHSRWLEEKSRG